MSLSVCDRHSFYFFSLPAWLVALTTSETLSMQRLTKQLASSLSVDCLHFT